MNPFFSIHQHVTSQCEWKERELYNLPGGALVGEAKSEGEKSVLRTLHFSQGCLCVCLTDGVKLHKI